MIKMNNDKQKIRELTIENRVLKRKLKNKDRFMKKHLLKLNECTNNMFDVVDIGLDGWRRDGFE